MFCSLCPGLPPVAEKHKSFFSVVMQPLYGFGGKDPARFARAAGHQDLVYVHDPELTFEQVCMLACLHSWPA